MRLRHIVFWITCLTLVTVLSHPVFAGQKIPQLPLCSNPELQHGLETVLKKLKLSHAASEKNLDVVLLDMSDLDHLRMASANPNHMMYAASLPKIAILLAAFEKIAAGAMRFDADTRQKLTRMIRNSSNSAATEMLGRVGRPYLAKLLQSPRYKLYDPQRNGGLWVGKDYAKTRVWKRDPLHNLSHGATALQVARFYYMLETGQLVSPAYSREMKTILSKPAIHHKFVRGLESVHSDALIYRKSGTWGPYHADSGLIEHEGHRYIAVALAKSRQGGRWLSNLIVELDRLVCATLPASG